MSKTIYCTHCGERVETLFAPCKGKPNPTIEEKIEEKVKEFEGEYYFCRYNCNDGERCEGVTDRETLEEALQDIAHQAKQEADKKWEKKYNKLDKIAGKYSDAISLMADGVEYEDLPKELK